MSDHGTSNHFHVRGFDGDLVSLDVGVWQDAAGVWHPSTTPPMPGTEPAPEGGGRMNTNLVKRNGRSPSTEEMSALLEKYRDGELPEDAAMRTVLERMIDGTQVVSPSAMIHGSSRGGSRLPGIVVAPATARTVEFHAERWDATRRLRRREGGIERECHLSAGEWTYPLDEDDYTWPYLDSRGVGHRFDAVASTPLIPPRVRAAHDLSDKLVAFEAAPDDWTVIRDWREVIPPPRPRWDPMLLQHLVGDLYTVVAQWELTDLELAVLAGLEAARS